MMRLLRGGFRHSIAPALWLRAVLCVLLMHIGAAGATEIIATSDRDPVSLQESFTLVFSATEEPDGEPDFSRLSRDFQIVRQGKSTRVHMVNGQLSRRTEWKLTVLAKRPGTLTVPQISFGEDLSRPFTLTVLPGRTAGSRSAGAEHLMLEVEAEPKNPYVQAQVLFTIRLLHRVALRNGQLDDPKLIDAVVQKLGDDRRYQTERNGQLYGVIERRYAVFPQKSGTLRIEPVNLEAELAGGPGSMFDQFFGQQGRIERIQSEPVDLQVRPIPAAFKGKHWLPAGNLKLEEAWSTSPPETKVGEPITRTLSVHAGGVTMGMVPELADRNGGAPAGLQRYPDQPALSEQQGAQGLTSLRREKTAFIPIKDGDYRIPGIEIAWWNTASDRMEIARVPERILKATPAPQLAAPEPDAAAPVPAEPAERSMAAPRAAAPPPIQHARSDLWFWLAWVCAAGWLATVLAWWWQSRTARRPEVSERTAPSPALSASLKALKHAVADRDPAAVRRALLDWGHARWPENPPGNLDRIAARLGGSAAQQIAELNRALYARTAGEWSGEGLVALIRDASAASERQGGKPQRRSGLEALYRT